MPGRGIMRAKQLRGGSLGQGTRFYYLGANKAPISKVAGAQGFDLWHDVARGRLGREWDV